MRDRTEGIGNDAKQGLKSLRENPCQSHKIGLKGPVAKATSMS